MTNSTKLLIGAIIIIPFIGFIYTANTGGTIEPFQLCTDLYPTEAVVPKELCPTQVTAWYCTEAGFWAEQCIGGDFDYEGLLIHFKGRVEVLNELYPNATYTNEGV